jgi:hypothetical protein
MGGRWTRATRSTAANGDITPISRDAPQQTSWSNLSRRPNIGRPSARSRCCRLLAPASRHTPPKALWSRDAKLLLRAGQIPARTRGRGDGRASCGRSRLAGGPARRPWAFRCCPRSVPAHAAWPASGGVKRKGGSPRWPGAPAWRHCLGVTTPPIPNLTGPVRRVKAMLGAEKLCLAIKKRLERPAWVSQDSVLQSAGSIRVNTGLFGFALENACR